MTGMNGSIRSQQLDFHTLAESAAVVRRLIDELRPAGYSEREMFGIRLALEEALVNAVKHGNRNDAAKTVCVRYQICDKQFLIEIHDEGRGFDPDGVPDPRAPENLDRPGGRGVFLIRHYMSWVQYNEVGNAVTLCKVRNA